MTGQPDITIIGAGVSGLLSARELVAAGAKVAIIEKQRVGQESSWAGGGILLPLYPWRQQAAITTLTLHSQRAYPQLAAELLESTGIDPQWQQSGLLITKNPDVVQAQRWCAEHQTRIEPATAAQLSVLSCEPQQPLWMPEIAHVRNPRLLQALHQDLLQRGVQIIEDCPLHRLVIDRQRISHIETACGRFPVGHLVMTSGAWSADLWPATSNAPIAIRPMKGQMLLYKGDPGLLNMMVLDGDQYLIPRRDGKILAGSTVENQGFDKTTSTAAHQQLHQFASSLFPPLAQLPIERHWAGLRPGTELGIPYIDTHPEIANLSINAGHFRNGLVMGPASARLLAALLNGTPPPFPAEPYRLSAAH